MRIRSDPPFWKELFTLVLPIALQALLTSLVSASDALMLGLLDQSALSAISLAGQVQFVLSLFHAVFMIGASTLAAQYWGIRDVDSVEQILGLSLRWSLPVSLLFTAAALGAPELLMRVFTGDPALIQLGIPYLRMVSPSYLMMGFSQMYLNIMKNSGQVLRSALYSSAAVVLNIGLNLCLIFGWMGLPALGILGAALATTLSRAVELLLCLCHCRRPGQIQVRPKSVLRRRRSLSTQFTRLMLPVLANEITWGCGCSMASVIMGHLGSDAVAANAIVSIVRTILLCFCTGLGAGSGILVGNRLGAGALEQAKACGQRLIRISLLSGAIAGGTLLALTPLLLRLGGNLTGQATQYLRAMTGISALYLVGKSLNGVLIGGLFCAGGDTRFGFLCDLINLWCVIIPLAALAAFVLKWPVMAVYLILNFDEIGKIPFEIAHYRKYKWLRNLTHGGAV